MGGNYRMRPMGKRFSIVLLRHGQSQWNLENRFTGWVDVDLTEQGRNEARQAGELLRSKGFEFDRAYTSVLNGPSGPSGSRWMRWIRFGFRSIKNGVSMNATTAHSLA